jgi:hypothetical protein
MLFIPACWWHELHNVESSLAINYWWRGEPSAPEFKRAMRYAQWQRFIGGVRRRIPFGGKRDI